MDPHGAAARSRGRRTTTAALGRPFVDRAEERRDLAFKIGRSIDRVTTMIDDLFDANRIGAGERLPLRLDVCDLEGVASDVVEELMGIHGERFALKVEYNARGVWSAEELRHIK